MIKSLLKLLLILSMGVLLIFAYQTKGYVDIRWQGVAISMKVGTFLVLVLLGTWVLFYVFSFIKYLAQLSKNLKEYWKNRHKTEGNRCLEEAISALAGGMQELATRKAHKGVELLKDSLLAKWIYALTSQEFGSVLDDKGLAELIKSKSFGLAGYRLRIEQLLKQGDQLAALAEIKTALERYPKAVWLLEEQFKLLVRQNDPYQAMDTAKKLQQLGHPDADSRMALCYLLKSKVESAPEKQLKYLQLAFDLEKTNPIIAISLSRAYIADNRSQKAKTVIESVWKYTRQSELGDIYLGILQGLNSDEVMSGALRLLDISNSSLEGYVVVIKACIDREFYQKARYYLEKAMQANGGMSYRLFELRVELTQKDGAEKLDYYGWIKQVVNHKRFEGWECATCSAELPQWTAECTLCGSVNSCFWHGEHEHENNFFAIKGA